MLNNKKLRKMTNEIFDNYLRMKILLSNAIDCLRDEGRTDAEIKKMLGIADEELKLLRIEFELNY